MNQYLQVQDTISRPLVVNSVECLFDTYLGFIGKFPVDI